MEEKDVQRLLDMLYGMIDEAKSVAFSSDKCIIVRDEALDLLDEIRAKLPLELKKAQELIAARSEYVAGAKKEAQEVLRQAELDARTIVSESETLQLARQKSSEIIRRAEDRSKELYHVANTYTGGRAAPHRGGHPGRADRGAGVPGAVPGRQQGADAGPTPAAERIRRRKKRGPALSAPLPHTVFTLTAAGRACGGPSFRTESEADPDRRQTPLPPRYPAAVIDFVENL